MVQRVRFRPIAALEGFFVLDGADGCSDLKMGSPSSSNRLHVSMSHAGYLREGLMFAAKLASVNRRAF